MSDQRARSPVMRRMNQLHRHILHRECRSAETPPVVHVDEEGLPAQPFLKAQSQQLGGMFTVRTPSGKERIVLTDPELFDGTSSLS